MGNDFYALLSTSTSCKIGILSTLFARVGLCGGDLVFEIWPEGGEVE